jgi:hypothetical protein
MIMKCDKMCSISDVMDWTDGGMLLNGGKGVGNVNVSVREMEVLRVGMERVTVIGNCR